MDVYASVTQKLASKKNKNSNGEKKGKNTNKTKKVVHDLFVQGTNDSSIVSKRSVEILYTDKVEDNAKQFFQYFVKKNPRRTPVINRGYWIRMKSIRMGIEKIIAQQPEHQRINIINLGCGYDPLPFQLLDDAKFAARNLFCIDVDFPELIDYKSQMIHMAPELVELIGQEHPTESNAAGVVIRTDNYATMGCDLTDKALYCKQLDSFMANSSSTTNIFIAEVSLAYMTPETANPIIQTSSGFSNSHFLILEQLMPSGPNHPFAKRMLKHFKKMEAPLQCVETYPTIPDQISRFQSLGYANVNARDVLSCWDLVDPATKQKVESVEAFDEWEEFMFFGQHYINLHATNQAGVKVYDEDYTSLYEPLESSTVDYYFSVQTDVDADLQRKFHSCLDLPAAKFVTSGTNQARLADTISLQDGSFVVETPESFKGRVSAVSVTVGDAAYLIGGRRMPGVGINEVWKFACVSGNYQWKQLASMNSGRVKHTAVAYNGGIIVYGGSHNEGFAYYSVEGNRWTDLSCDVAFAGYQGSKLVNVEGGLYIVGGKILGTGSGFEFNDTVYKVVVNLETKKVDVEAVFCHQALARFGHVVHSHGSRILLIGGVGKKLYDQKDTVVEVDVARRTMTCVPIDGESWSKSNVLIGTDIITTPDAVSLVLGGAVCYGFGSVWGGVFNVGIGVKPSGELEFNKTN